MIDRLVDTLFRWERLRWAIFEEVHLYDYLDEIMADPESMEIASCNWVEEDGLWRGWSFDKDQDMYLFNDLGYEDLLSLWQVNWEWKKDISTDEIITDGHIDHRYIKLN